MKGKVMKRFAAGTCSVCMLYALAYSALSRSDSVKAESASAVTVLSSTQSAAQAAPEASASPPVLGSSNSAGYTGRRKHSDRSYGATESQTVTQGDTSGTQSSSTDITAQSGSSGDSTAIAGTDTAGSSPPTLAEYLSALRCSGCRHNCLLVNPRCMRGRSKAAAATNEYNQLYGDV